MVRVVLVLSGVQHVDCVTFSTLSCLLNVQSEKEKEEEQKKGEEKEREREEEEDEEKQEEKLEEE